MELSPTCKNFGPEIWPRIFTPKFFPKKQPQCNFGEKIALETDLSPHCDNSQNTVSLFNFSGRRRPLQICEILHECKLFHFTMAGMHSSPNPQFVSPNLHKFRTNFIAVLTILVFFDTLLYFVTKFLTYFFAVSFHLNNGNTEIRNFFLLINTEICADILPRLNTNLKKIGTYVLASRETDILPKTGGHLAPGMDISSQTTAATRTAATRTAATRTAATRTAATCISVTSHINVQHLNVQKCCSVNLWQILHDTNESLLTTHTAHNVQDKNQSQDPEVSAHFLPFLSGSPLLLVEMNAQKLIAMVDTGCSKNLCSSTAIAKIWPNYQTLLQDYLAPFSDVQGQLLSTKGMLQNVSIVINTHKFVIDIIIFESNDLTFLLGFEFIKTFDLQITAKGLALPANVCHQIKMTHSMSSPLKIAVHLHESVYIEANSSKLVKANLELQNVKIPIEELHLKHLIASSEDLQPNVPIHKLQVFHQYINIPVNGQIYLQFSNFHPYSITMHAGEVIAQVEEMQFPQPHINTQYRVNQCKSLHNVSMETTVREVGKATNNKKESTSCRSSVETNKKDHQLQIHQTFVNQPVFNEVYAICRHLNQLEHLTEIDVQERLSQMQYHANKSNPKITNDDINIQSNDPAHIQFTRNLVYSHAKLFTAHPLDVGRFQGPPIQLKVRAGVEPVALPQYPISPKLLPATRRLISRLMDMGVIGYSTSPWNLPIFVLSKKRGEKQNPKGSEVALEQKSTVAGSIQSTDLRMILDSRIINVNLQRNYQDFPIPRTIDIIHNLYGAKYIGIFDVSNAFFSHRLSRATSQLFAWTFENLKLEFRSLPQGCVASPTIFCSFITRLVTTAGLTRFENWPDGGFDGVQVYFDNIVVSARTESNYQKMLLKLFDVLMSSGYRLKISKAFFYILHRFIIFGYEINIQDQTCMPERKKIDNLLAIQIPKSRKQVRAILGSFAYFHTLLPNINQILAPLYNLSSDKVKFVWTEEHTQALEKAKRMIGRCPFLFLPNPAADFYVWTDACLREVCSFFCYQYSKKHKSLVLISCYSHKLTLAERSFSQYHVELYAIVLFCTKFYHKIQHSRTWIFSDCAALSYCIRYKAENSCLLRYWTLLHSLDLRILFTPAHHPLLKLVDLTTRKNNALKLLNRRLTREDIKDFPILDWTGLPPMSLEEIERIVHGFFNYEARIKNNQYCPNLPKAVRINYVNGHAHTQLVQEKQGNESISQHSIDPATWKVINHCHAMFPTSHVAILNTSQCSSLSQDEDHPQLSFSTEALHIQQSSPTELQKYKPNRTTLGQSATTICKFPPLPPAAVTDDKKWLLTSNNIFATKMPSPSNTPPIQANIYDYIINKECLYAVINAALPNMHVSDFIETQKTDKRLSTIIQTISRKNHLNYIVFHNVLCKMHNIKQFNNQVITIYKILCPDALALSLLKSLHVQQMVHLNFSRLHSRVRTHWHVRNFPEKYRHMIDTCTFCALNVPQPHRTLHKTTPVYYGPYNAVSFDHCVVNSSWKIDGFLNITEQFSTHITLIPMHSKSTASEILQAIYTRYIAIYKRPKFLIKDNASNLTNTLIDSIAQLLHIKCLYTTPYNSRSNSKCEMNNKKALNCFRLLHQTLPGGLNEDYLAIYCAGIANCLNNLPLRSLEGVSPQYIMTGQSENVATYIPCSSLNLPPSVISKYHLYQHYGHMYEVLYAIYLKQREKFMTTKQVQSHAHNFTVGQFVRIREANPMRGSQRKLRPIYSSIIYRIMHLTHSTAMLLDISAQMYYKSRLKGRGKLICPKIKRVKINQLKICEKPQHFLKISDKKLEAVLADIEKIKPQNIGYIRGASDKDDHFEHLDSDQHLSALINSSLFKNIPYAVKYAFQNNRKKMQDFKQAKIGANQSFYTFNGIFVTNSDPWPFLSNSQIQSSPQQEIHSLKNLHNQKYKKLQIEKSNEQEFQEDGKYRPNYLISAAEAGQNVQKMLPPFESAATFVHVGKTAGQDVCHVGQNVRPRGKIGQNVRPCMNFGRNVLRPKVDETQNSELPRKLRQTKKYQKFYIKIPCQNIHQNLPCVSYIVKTEEDSFLPWSKTQKTSENNLNFSHYRKTHDAKQKLPPLYKNLAKHRIHPHQIFVKPFVNLETQNPSKKLEQCLKRPPHIKQNNTEYRAKVDETQKYGINSHFPTFDVWRKFYPMERPQSSVSAYFFSTSDISEELAHTFSQASSEHQTSSSSSSSIYESISNDNDNDFNDNHDSDGNQFVSDDDDNNEENIDNDNANNDNNDENSDDNNDITSDEQSTSSKQISSPVKYNDHDYDGSDRDDDDEDAAGKISGEEKTGSSPPGLSRAEKIAARHDDDDNVDVNNDDDNVKKQFIKKGKGPASLSGHKQSKPVRLQSSQKNANHDDDEHNKDKNEDDKNAHDEKVKNDDKYAHDHNILYKTPILTTKSSSLLSDLVKSPESIRNIKIKMKSSSPSNSAKAKNTRNLDADEHNQTQSKNAETPPIKNSQNTKIQKKSVIVISERRQSLRSSKRLK